MTLRFKVCVIWLIPAILCMTILSCKKGPFSPKDDDDQPSAPPHGHSPGADQLLNWTANQQQYWANVCQQVDITLTDAAVSEVSFQILIGGEPVFRDGECTLPFESATWKSGDAAVTGYVKAASGSGELNIKSLSAAIGFQPEKIDIEFSGPRNFLPAGNFGNGGLYSRKGTSNLELGGMYVSPSGSEILLGVNSVGETGAEIFRLKSDGTIDSSFSSAALKPTGNGSSSFELQSIAVGDAGVTVVAGGFSDSGDNAGIFLLNQNGTLNTGFSGDGFASAGQETFDDRCHDVVLMPGNRLLCAGMVDKTTHGELYFVNLSANGQPDTAFGSGGQVILSDFDINLSSEVYAVRRASSDRYLIAATIGDGQFREGLVLGLDVDGKVSTDYGISGSFKFKVGENPTLIKSIREVYDGTFVAGSYEQDGRQHGFVGKIAQDGKFASSFGQSGIVSVSAADQNMVIQAVEQHRTGYVIAAGNRSDGQQKACVYIVIDPVGKIVPAPSGDEIRGLALTSKRSCRVKDVQIARDSLFVGISDYLVKADSVVGVGMVRFEMGP